MSPFWRKMLVPFAVTSLALGATACGDDDDTEVVDTETETETDS